MGGEQKPCRKEGCHRVPFVIAWLEVLVSPAGSLLIRRKWEEDGSSQTEHGLLLDVVIVKAPGGHLNHQTTAKRRECFHNGLYNKITFTNNRGRRGPGEKGLMRVKPWVCVLVEDWKGGRRERQRWKVSKPQQGQVRAQASCFGP